MSKILSLHDIRQMRAEAHDPIRYGDFWPSDIESMLVTLERYACAIENSWAVGIHCKHCGAVIQEWPLVGSNTGPVCHHSLDCVVMQVKGAG